MHNIFHESMLVSYYNLCVYDSPIMIFFKIKYLSKLVCLIMMVMILFLKLALTIIIFVLKLV